MIVAGEESGTVRVRAGEVFAVELPVNPSTGYRWEARLPPGLEVVATAIAPLPADGMVGRPTVQRWQLLAASGAAQLAFELLPPGGEAPARVVLVAVVAV